MSIAKLKRSKKVMYVDDERDIGNSLIVTLNYGYRFEDEGHVKGFDDPEEAWEEVKHLTVKCNCEECRENKKKPATRQKIAGKMRKHL